MKTIKRSLLMLILLTSVGFLFRGWIYRHVVTYKSVGTRTTYPASDKNFTQYIDSYIDNQMQPDIKQIIKLALAITSEKLNYAAQKTDIDPNILFTSRKAHCVGYAAFCTTTCNYLLKKYDLAYQWTDHFVDHNGNILTYSKAEYNLDQIFPGRTYHFLQMLRQTL